MKASYKVSIGGVIGALSLVLMLLTSLVPFGTFAFPTFAGILLICIVFELGYSWAFVVYGVVSVLSLLMLVDKEAALYYTMFLGFYPVVKGLIERIPSKIAQYIVKFALFNTCVISAFFISINIFAIPKESFNLFGLYIPWVFLILGNLIFLPYDRCVSIMVVVYMQKFHKIFKNKSKL